jgi:undecaprenyl-diphosphatase
MISDYFLALLLALIQGLTEFLPVSSSAHLLFPSLLFGAKDFGIVFDISVHAGTLAAVMYFFKKDIQGLIYAWMPWQKTRSKEDFSLGLNLLVATLPIVLVGLLASDLTESRSANINSIAWANLVFAGLLYAAFKSSRQSKSLAELTLIAALIIGCFQALAVFPGASRSGMAITGALIIGLNIKDTSKFAFLLSIPTILGALVLMLAKGAYSIELSDILIMLTGFIGSALIAFFTIKSFLQFVEKIGMTPFVLYRVALGDGAFAYMIPPLVYAAGIQQSLAEDTASN